MMAMPPTFILSNDTAAQRLWAFLKRNWTQMAAAGKPLVVVVTEHKGRRTGAQNRALHAMFSSIAEHAWIDGRQFSAEAWKELLVRELAGTEDLILPTGEIVQRRRSTADMDVVELSELLDKVAHYAVTELGLEIDR